MEISDLDLDRFAQGLLLHVAMRLPLQPKGEEFVKRLRNDSQLRERFDATLDRISVENEHGVRRMAPEQAQLVRGLYALALV